MEKSVLLIAVMLMLVLQACQTDAVEQDVSGVIQVEDVKYSLLPGGARIVTGMIYNPSEVVVRNAQIQVSLFDSNNRLVSSMSIPVKDVPPGERKSFRQPVDVDMDIRGAKVKSVLVM